MPSRYFGRTWQTTKHCDYYRSCSYIYLTIELRCYFHGGIDIVLHVSIILDERYPRANRFIDGSRSLSESLATPDRTLPKVYTLRSTQQFKREDRLKIVCHTAQFQCCRQAH